MSAAQHNKFRKNAIVLYDDDGHDEPFRMAYTQNGVEMKFDHASPAPFVMQGANLNLAHATYPVPDVGKAIHDLQSAQTTETAARTAADTDHAARLGATEQGLTDEITRASAAEGKNAASIVSEASRAQAAEATNASSIAAMDADQKTKHDAIDAWQATEQAARESADSKLRTDLDTEIARSTAADASGAQAVADEKTRAMQSEQEIKAELDAYKSSNDNAVSSVNTSLTNLVNQTTQDTLDSLQAIADQLTAADGDLAAALNAALAQARDDHEQQQKFVHDLSDRLAYLEGVVIQTFDNDRDGDNGPSYNVTADVAELGEGKQSGLYKQVTSTMVLNASGAAELGEFPAFVRADGKYSMMYDLGVGGWVLVFGNASISAGRFLPKFNFNGGNAPAGPAGNDAFGVTMSLNAF